MWGGGGALAPPFPMHGRMRAHRHTCGTCCPMRKTVPIQERAAQHRLTPCRPLSRIQGQRRMLSEVRPDPGSRALVFSLNLSTWKAGARDPSFWPPQRWAQVCGLPPASMRAAVCPPASSEHYFCQTALHGVCDSSRKRFELHGPPEPRAIRDDEAGLVRQTGSVHRGRQVPLRAGDPALPSSCWPTWLSPVPYSPRASLLLSVPLPAGLWIHFNFFSFPANLSPWSLHFTQCLPQYVFL